MKERTKSQIVGVAGGVTALGAAVYMLKHRKAPRLRVSLGKAKKIGEELGIEFTRFGPDDLRRGMEVELEHGRRDPETDVTGDDLLLTGKIALAHLKEIPDYYSRLAKMEADAKAFWRDIEGVEPS